MLADLEETTGRPLTQAESWAHSFRLPVSSSRAFYPHLCFSSLTSFLFSLLFSLPFPLCFNFYMRRTCRSFLLACQGSCVLGVIWGLQALLSCFVLGTAGCCFVSGLCCCCLFLGLKVFWLFGKSIWIKNFSKAQANQLWFFSISVDNLDWVRFCSTPRDLWQCLEAFLWVRARGAAVPSHSSQNSPLSRRTVQPEAHSAEATLSTAEVYLLP